MKKILTIAAILVFLLAPAMAAWPRLVTYPGCRLENPEPEPGTYSSIKGTLYITAIPPAGEKLTGVSVILTWVNPNVEFPMSPVLGVANRYYYTLTPEQEPKEPGYYPVWFLLKTDKGTGSFGERCSIMVTYRISSSGTPYQAPMPIQTLALIFSSFLFIFIIGIIIFRMRK
ncbi:MAG: hypothetical protein ACTSWZ_07780 [Candidatus Heimdallarchaeaceae archaeon]